MKNSFFSFVQNILTNVWFLFRIQFHTFECTNKYYRINDKRTENRTKKKKKMIEKVEKRGIIQETTFKMTEFQRWIK